MALVVKNPPTPATTRDKREMSLIPRSGRSPGKRNGNPFLSETAIPIFLPVEYHGQRSLAGYSPWGCTESDTTGQPSSSSGTQASVAPNESYVSGAMPLWPALTKRRPKNVTCVKIWQMTVQRVFPYSTIVGNPEKTWTSLFEGEKTHRKRFSRQPVPTAKHEWGHFGLPTLGWATWLHQVSDTRTKDHPAYTNPDSPKEWWVTKWWWSQGHQVLGGSYIAEVINWNIATSGKMPC